MVLRALVLLVLGIFPHVGVVQSVLALVFGFLAAAVLLAPPLYGNPERRACDGIWLAQTASALAVLGVLGCGVVTLVKRMDTTALCDGCYEWNCVGTDAWTCPSLDDRAWPL